MTDKRKKVVLLLLFGIVAAIFVLLQSFPLRKQATSNIFHAKYGDVIGTYNGQRLSQLEELMRIYDGTADNSNLAEDIDTHGQLFYMILAKIGVRFGWTPIKLFYMVQFFASCLLILCCPLLFYYMSNKLWVAFISPLLLFTLSKAYFFNHLSDTYWAAPWCMLFSLPLFVGILRRKEWKKSENVAISAIIISMIMANIVRSSSGIAIFISLFFLCIYKIINGKKKIHIGVIGSIGIICYFYVERLIIMLWKIFENIQIPKSASPWHAIWCGLGYLPNNYGFEWNDLAAYERAREVNKQVILYSQEYYAILKKDCINVFIKDPLFIINTCVTKGIDSLKVIFCNNLGVVCILLAAIAIIVYLISSKCSQSDFAHLGENGDSVILLLFGVINTILGVAQGIVGYPEFDYILGGFAGVTYVIIGLLYFIGCEISSIVAMHDE